MGVLTHESYQFDASISIEDSNTYYDIISEINSNLKDKLNTAVQNLIIAKTIIDFDPSNQSIIASKINDINNINNDCNSIGSKIDTGVRIYEEYDSSLKEILDCYLIDGLFNGMEIHFKEDGTVKEMDLDKLFEYFDGNQDGSYYGCNQNPYKHIKDTDPEYYEYLRKMMSEKYGLSEDDIDFFMGKVDVESTCTYARCVNDVIFAYKDRPDLFEETFGYPLYIKNSEGKMILNYTELLTDYIVTSCCKTNPNNRIPPFISKVGDKYVMNREGNVYGGMQSWMNEHYFFEEKTKNSKVPISCEVDIAVPEESNITKEELKAILERIMKDGNSASIGMIPKALGQNYDGDGTEAKTIPFYSQENGSVYDMGGNHWVTITEITDEGIIVDSWGEKCLVTYDDLVNNSFYSVHETKFGSGE